MLSDTFRQEHLNLMDAFKRGLSSEYCIVTADLATKRWVIGRLIAKSIGYAMLNMGAGVVKITTKTTTCPKCKGLGCVADKTTLA